MENKQKDRLIKLIKKYCPDSIENFDDHNEIVSAIDDIFLEYSLMNQELKKIKQYNSEVQDFFTNSFNEIEKIHEKYYKTYPDPDYS